jgi:glycosyltransferase involved in cell wall biosynthesis
MTPVRRMPLRTLFLTTSMPVGGAETLLMNLVRRMDRKRFAPEIVCLKEPGPLGELLACEMRVHSHMLRKKWDARVLGRLWRIMRIPRADAVITVGCGDKMFWGRLAARLAGVPVIASALHSTGWPDGVGRINRMLTPITDAFIGVADAHGQHLVENERFPADKVHVIYNGVDTDRFAPQDATETRRSLGIAADAPVVGILAALRPEKNHELFLAGAKNILAQQPATQFIIVGDGPKRHELESLAVELGVNQAVHFLGTRSDVPALLAACDLVALTSHNEAAPVSILEALSTGVPVVASDVGSVRETVRQGQTGRVFPAGDVDAYVAAALQLLSNPAERRQLGAAGRRLVVDRWSLDAMVRGYEQLIHGIYDAKTRPALAEVPSAPERPFDPAFDGVSTQQSPA